MKGKKRIKRNPGKKSVLYFTKDTEESIVNFLQETNSSKREHIYRQEILPAMHKLVESLIFVYGFNSPTASTADLIDEGCYFLYSALHKWNPDRGTKAFSYFNVVAKNFLINTTNGHKKKVKRHVYIDDILSVNNDTQKQLSEHLMLESPEETIIRKEIYDEKIHYVSMVKERLKKDKDIKVANAVEKLFNSASEIDFFNKQSLYVYLVEMTGFDKKDVTRSMSKIRKVYREIADKYDRKKY